MHIYVIPLLRHHAPGGRGSGPPACSVDRVAVLACPLAKIAQTLNGLVRKFAIGHRADVEQQVGIATGGTHQIMDEFARTLVGIIHQIEAPALVYGVTSLVGHIARRGFVKSRGVLSGQIALKSLCVFARPGTLMMIGNNQGLWLQTMDEAVSTVELPVGVRLR